ncbi:MAG: cell division protein SepF [Clostridia bacterium]|nr:cell division protein SepF [Clostridia bacterium]
MSKWDKLKAVIGIPDDSDIMDNEADTEETPVKTAVSEDYSPKKEAPRTAVKTPVSSARSQVNMVIIKSSDYGDARTVADHILGNRAVLLNLENCNKDMAQRILDFLSGVVYAQGGDLQRVAHSTYAVTPRNVGLQGELTDELKEEEY